MQGGSPKASPSASPWQWSSSLCQRLIPSTFTTQRSTVIHDTRLAAVHLVLVVLIVLYIIFIQGCLQHGYARFESASAVSQAWAASLPAPSSSTSSAASAPPHYCSNASYNWGVNLAKWEQAAALNAMWGPEVVCIPFIPQRHTIVENGAFAVLTSLLLRPLDAVANVTPAQLAVAAATPTLVLLPNVQLTDGSNVTLKGGYGGSYPVFLNDAGSAPFNFLTVLSPSWASSSVAMPETWLHDASGAVVKVFPLGSFVASITLSEVMAWAGTALDAGNPQAWIQGGDPAFTPFVRNTGQNLLVRLEFSNLRQWEFPTLSSPSRFRCDVYFETLPAAWGYVGSSTSFVPGVGNVLVTNFGVSLHFAVSGTIGYPSATQVVALLVSGTVLIGLAQVITTIISSYLLHGDVSGDLFRANVTAEMLAEAKRARAAAVKTSDGAVTLAANSTYGVSGSDAPPSGEKLARPSTSLLVPTKRAVLSAAPPVLVVAPGAGGDDAQPHEGTSSLELPTTSFEGSPEAVVFENPLGPGGGRGS